MYVTCSDLARVRAGVVNESQSGIRVEVLDISPFAYQDAVLVSGPGAPLRACILRITTGNEFGWHHLGMEWQN